MTTSPSISTNGPQLVYRFTVGSQSGEIPAVSLVNSDGSEITFGTGATAQQVQGNIANAIADAGNPIKVGGVGSSVALTAVTNGQRVNGWFNLNGQQMVQLTDGSTNATFANPSVDGLSVAPGLATRSYGVVFNNTSWDRQRGDANATVMRSALGSASLAYAGVTGGITNNTAVAMFAAAGAGTRNFLHGLQWKNTSAVASEIVVLDGATVIWRGHASASMTMSDGYRFDPPLRGTANTAMNVQMVTTGTATIVSAQGSTGV